MNASAAILDNDELAKFERQEAAELAPEIVRDLEREHQEPIEDKLPAELASISEMFSAMVERKAEIDRKAAEDIAAVDAQMLRTLNQVLRRLAVKEEMYARKAASEKVTLKNIEIAIGSVLSAVEIISDTTDGAAAVAHETEEYGRLYREQYEHAPEPPEDDGGSRAPVTQRDRELVDAVDFDTAQLRDWLAKDPRSPVVKDPGRFLPRIARTARAMLNPEQFIRRNAPPPFRAA